VAEVLKKQGIQVELVNGNRGEYTVLVDGRVVAEKHETLPSVDEVLAAINKPETATAKG
jgi:hypothetical protein